MAIWLKWNKGDDYEMKFVFNNTGREREETLTFVQQVDQHYDLGVVWLEADVKFGEKKSSRHRIVSYDKASRNGEPFEDVIAKYGIPNKAFPHCSRELKLYPTQSYARSIGWEDCQYAIGIRIDEIDRMSANRKRDRLIYPLISMIPTTKYDINAFWMTMPFDLQLKSYEGNCDLCWKKSDRKLLTIIKENPQLTDWWRDMEAKYGEFVPEGKRPAVDKAITFFRKGRLVNELVELSKQHFVKATDESYIKNIQTQLFDVEYVINDFDEPDGCEESCEPF
jgi:hypothetical protein